MCCKVCVPPPAAGHTRLQACTLHTLHALHALHALHTSALQVCAARGVTCQSYSQSFSGQTLPPVTDCSSHVNWACWLFPTSAFLLLPILVLFPAWSCFAVTIVLFFSCFLLFSVQLPPER